MVARSTNGRAAVECALATRSKRSRRALPRPPATASGSRPVHATTPIRCDAREGVVEISGEWRCRPNRPSSASITTSAMLNITMPAYGCSQSIATRRPHACATPKIASTRTAFSVQSSTSAVPIHSALRNRVPVTSAAKATLTNTKPTTPSIPEHAGATSITYGSLPRTRKRVDVPPAGRAQCVTASPPRTVATVSAVNGVSTRRNRSAQGNGHASTSTRIVARWRWSSARPNSTRIAPATKRASAGTSTRHAHAADHTPVLPSAETAAAAAQQAMPTHVSRRVSRAAMRGAGRVSATRSAIAGTSPVYARGESTPRTRRDARSVWLNAIAVATTMRRMRNTRPERLLSSS